MMFRVEYRGYDEVKVLAKGLTEKEAVDYEKEIVMPPDWKRDYIWIVDESKEAE